MTEASPLATTRVRHPLKRRLLQVTRVTSVTPHLKRVTLTGDDLDDFVSASFDDHVKVFFPLPGQTRPALGEGEEKPIARDFTPRRYDAVGNTLEIDFAIHDAGPATRWAAQAKSGDELALGGPRGSFIIPVNYDWHLLVGDETALPAISRRLAELPPKTRAVVVGEVEGAADELSFATQANATVIWAHRNGAAAGASDAMAKALTTLKMPAGDYYAWVACESLTAKALRRQLIADHGANPKWMRAAGYWRRGTAAVHDVHED